MWGSNNKVCRRYSIFLKSINTHILVYYIVEIMQSEYRQTTENSHSDHWYVVFTGKKPGIYTSWGQCLKNLGKLKGPTYRRYTNFETAHKAYLAYFAIRQDNFKKNQNKQMTGVTPENVISLYTQINPADTQLLEVQYPCLVVDAACNNPAGGNVEYQCYKLIDLTTKVKVFTYGPFTGGSNNIGEYIVLVKALHWLYTKYPPPITNDQSQSDLQVGKLNYVYSDSMIAIGWVKQGTGCKTKLNVDLLSTELKAEISECDHLLKTNSNFLTFCHERTRKWITALWGENPADYDRK